MIMASTAVVFSSSLTPPSSSVTDSPNFNQNTQVQAQPNFHNLNGNIEPLKSCRSLREMRQLQGHFTKNGLMGNPIILTKLIAKYSEFCSYESLEYAQKAFRIFKHRREDCSSSSNTVYLYNSLIRGNSSVGAFHEAIFVYIDMLTEGVIPDSYTFPFVLKACAKGFRLSEAEQIHGAFCKMGIHNDVFVLNSLVHCYGKCGEIDRARKVFDEMPVRNVVSWTSLICGYARRDRHKEAFSLFTEMVEAGIEPNEVTLVSVISSCAKLGELDLGQKVLDCVAGSGLCFNAFVVNALVDMYMKCRAEHKAMQLFNNHVDKPLVLYNTIMSNYVKLGKVKDAIDVFREMLSVGLKPDRVTMLSVIISSAELGDSWLGMQSHAYTVRNGLECSESIQNSLIDMYTKCGRQEWACRVFDQMPNKTVVSWNSLLAGFGRNGDVESARRLFDQMVARDIVTWNAMIGALVQRSLFVDAIELFNTMQKEGMMANEVTMVSVASACGYLGSLDLAKWIHYYIKKCGIPCNLWLSTALIDMFARCGAPECAMEVFGKMKEKDASAWTAAIGAMAMEGSGQVAVELFNEMVRQGTVPDEVAVAAVLTACNRTGLVKQGMDIFNVMKEHRVVNSDDNKKKKKGFLKGSRIESGWPKQNKGSIGYL